MNQIARFSRYTAGNNLKKLGQLILKNVIKTYYNGKKRKSERQPRNTGRIKREEEKRGQMFVFIKRRLRSFEKD